MDVAAAPRWWVAAAIARRDAASMLCGIGVYVTLALAVVAAAWLLLIDVRALAAGGLLVMADPFASPLAVAAPEPRALRVNASSGRLMIAARTLPASPHPRRASASAA